MMLNQFTADKAKMVRVEKTMLFIMLLSKLVNIRLSLKKRTLFQSD